MSDEPVRRGLMTPARAWVIAIAWIVAGIVLRLRFRVVGCDEVGGGSLAIYCLLTAMVLLWLYRDGNTMDVTYRRASAVVGLAFLVLMLSACVPYSAAQSDCSS